ncbi:MAG: hypothetical protein HUU37_01790 [Bdellovibrionales bacterium]|nr:hypothetical protein [Bdellovibrionales bacterium]
MKNMIWSLFLMAFTATASAAPAPRGPLLATMECTDTAGKPARVDFYPWPEAWVHRWESAQNTSQERFLRASAPGEIDLRFFEPSSDNELHVPRVDAVETSLHFSRSDEGGMESWSCRILAGSLMDPRLEGEQL